MNVFLTLPRRGGDGRRLGCSGVRKWRFGFCNLFGFVRSGTRPPIADLTDGRKLALGIRPHQVRLGAVSGTRAGAEGAGYLEPVARRSDPSRHRSRRSAGHRRLRRCRRCVDRQRRSDLTLPLDSPPSVRRRERRGAASRARCQKGSGGVNASGDLIIGLDAGTSVIKAVAFTLDGKQIDRRFRRVQQWSTISTTAAPNKTCSAPGATRRSALRFCWPMTCSGSCQTHRRTRHYRPGRRHLADRCRR